MNCEFFIVVSSGASQKFVAFAVKVLYNISQIAEIEKFSENVTKIRGLTRFIIRGAPKYKTKEG